MPSLGHLRQHDQLLRRTIRHSLPCSKVAPPPPPPPPPRANSFPGLEMRAGGGLKRREYQVKARYQVRADACYSFTATLSCASHSLCEHVNDLFFSINKLNHRSTNTGLGSMTSAPRVGDIYSAVEKEFLIAGWPTRFVNPGQPEIRFFFSFFVRLMSTAYWWGTRATVLTPHWFIVSG